MKVIIVGAGFTGTQLARALIQEKHEVSLIESDENMVRNASNRLDCLVLHAEGNSLKSLEEAGIAKANALVCVTDSDEVNMIICGLAASRYHKLVKIARVRNENYMNPHHDTRVFDIDRIVHPDIEAAREVLDALSHGAQGNILRFPGTPYELGSVNIQEGSQLDGLSLMNFNTLVHRESLIPLIERGQECFLPSGSTSLCSGDLIHIMAKEEAIDSVFRLAGKSGSPIRRIGIVGGGRLGCLIIEGLLSTPGKFLGTDRPRKGKFASLFRGLAPKSSHRLIIIEQNYQVCKDLAARFPEALILNDDITDENFIAEERMGDLDVIITATDNQELNIIAAIYLKSRGVKRAISLVLGPGYKTVALQLGVDVAIPMKSVVVDSILTHLMGKGVSGYHSLGDGNIVIVEHEISEHAPVVGKPISEFTLPSGGLAMLVKRGEESFIPKGDYIFQAADTIMVITKSGSEGEMEKIFGHTAKGDL